jgi:hypothetical protein
VVIAILSAGCGDHDHIMLRAASRSTVRDRTTGADRLCCRQLAQTSADCRDRQLGEEFDPHTGRTNRVKPDTVDKANKRVNGRHRVNSSRTTILNGVAALV